MGKENANVQVLLPDTEKPVQLVIQDKEQAKNLKSVSISGNIHACAEFATKRATLLKEKKDLSYVVVDKNVENTKIKLVVDESNPYNNYTILGELHKNEELLQFGINSGKKMSKDDLLTFIKRTAYYFPDKSENEKLIVALNKLHGTITTHFRNEKDTQGNSTFLVEKSTNLSEEMKNANHFKLKVPLFVGEEPLVFRVELCLDPADSSVRFFLESDELFELMLTERDRLLEKALEPFTKGEAKDIPVIYV